MLLKRSEIIELCELMDSLPEEYFDGFKIFNYHINKNRKILDDEYKLILETGKPKESYVQFEREKYNNVLLKYCVLDEENKLKDFDGKFKIKEGYEEEVKSKLTELAETYKDVIKERENELKEFFDFLNGSVEVNVVTIPLQSISDKLKKSEMKVLLPLIQ